MYTFAHDTAADSIIRCGLFTTAYDAMPWTPQFAMFKARDAVDGWSIVDTARGWGGGNDPYLTANSSAAEVSTGDFGTPASPLAGTYIANPSIYVAIRAP